jgi:hypothetical protein
VVKQISFIGLVITLLLPIQASPSYAAAKAGAKCTKVGIKSVAGNKTYTCIKSGKKLVWNKGISLGKPTPTPSPIVIDTYENLVLRPVDKNWQKIYKATFQNFLKSESNTTAIVNYTLSPTVNKDLAEKTIAAYSRGMRLWTNLYKQERPINWVIMSEKDYEWWRIQVPIMEGSQGDLSVWNNSTNSLLSGHCILSVNAYCGYGSGGGWNQNNKIVFYLVIGSARQYLEFFVAHHESTHFYQMTFFQGNLVAALPCWFTEGQATFFENAIAPYLQNTNYFGRKWQTDRIYAQFPDAKNYSSAQWLSRMQGWKATNRCTDGDIHYAFGMLAFEAIHSEYSITQMHQVLQEMINGSTWSESLVKVLGINENALDEKIATYVVSTLKDD